MARGVTSRARSKRRRRVPSARLARASAWAWGRHDIARLELRSQAPLAGGPERVHSMAHDDDVTAAAPPCPPSTLPAPPGRPSRTASSSSPRLPDECIDVATGAALIARDTYATLDVERLLARFDDARGAARRARPRVAAARGAGRRRLGAPLRDARLPRQRARLLRSAQQPAARRARPQARDPHHAGARLLRGRAARRRARARA